VSNLTLNTAATSIRNTGAFALSDSVVSGQLDLDGSAGIALNGIAAGGQAVTLTAGGAITDANGDAPNITAASADLNASTGIGAGDALETAVPVLTFANTSNGVEIASLGAVSVSGSNTSGSIDIQAPGSVTVVPAGVRSGGDLQIRANAGTLTLNGPVTSTRGDINLLGFGGVSQNADITVTNGGRVVRVFTELQDVNANPGFVGGGITMQSGVTTRNVGGQISYTGANDVLVSLVDAGTTGTVTLTAVNGDLLNQADQLVTAGAATLQAIGVRAGGQIGVSAGNAFNLAQAVNDISVAFSTNAFLSSPNVVALNNLTLLSQGSYQVDPPNGAVILVGVANANLFSVSLAATQVASGQSQLASEEELEDVDAALLKPAIKIYGVVGTGILLPPDQREDMDAEFSALMRGSPEGAEIKAEWIEQGTSYLMPQSWYQ
jgi:hypothetical protein